VHSRSFAVRRQCPRGHYRLDHRQVGSLMMSFFVEPVRSK
jgi:hypothetical protein